MSKRPKMLASVIRKAIAPVILTCPPACGIVSITDVVVSPDGTSVKIFVSALKSTDAAVTYLSGNIRDIKHRLTGLEFRRMPDVRIEADRRGERGSRVEELLRDSCIE